jgi:hypothetical protein
MTSERATIGQTPRRAGPLALKLALALGALGLAPAPASASAPSTASGQVFLNALPSAKGLQVGFPMEVLAEALRPLVIEWVQANLPAITERLLREEIARLTAEQID